ncbi:hypothetical protein B5X24_HaOG211435 [Helicoverpa armigera]|nr:hypothetical protein B5X24_HaOG211435 [Helicoverpa armigera]
MVDSTAGLTAAATVCIRTAVIPLLGAADLPVHYQDPAVDSLASRLPPDWPTDNCVLKENVHIVVSFFMFLLLTAAGLLGFMTEYSVKSHVDVVK